MAPADDFVVHRALTAIWSARFAGWILPAYLSVSPAFIRAFSLKMLSLFGNRPRSSRP